MDFCWTIDKERDKKDLRQHAHDIQMVLFVSPNDVHQEKRTCNKLDGKMSNGYQDDQSETVVYSIDYLVG
jgi:hypothetical protein